MSKRMTSEKLTEDQGIDLEKWTFSQFRDRMTLKHFAAVIGAAFFLFVTGLTIGNWVSGPVAQRELSILQSRLDSIKSARLSPYAIFPIESDPCTKYGIQRPDNIPTTVPLSTGFQFSGSMTSTPDKYKIWFLSKGTYGGSIGYFPREEVTTHGKEWSATESKEDRGMADSKQYGIYLFSEDVVRIIHAYESDMSDMHKKWIAESIDSARYEWKPLRLPSSVVNECFDFTVKS